MGERVEVRPALTEEEWEVVRLRHSEINEYRRPVSLADEKHIDYPTRHAAAALALHGQPFGFTHSDVGIIRAAAQRILVENNFYVANSFHRNLNEIADRISALLPPEEK